ncbi:Pre-mRNA-splicing factor cwf19 [Ceratocystis fimbriata CBS 114723]|uniref:Pre-mRNA-splicing factor cwf19 n=1 Tax=Ceratocystis fimbriata CBS 114723 TaxID=1035309 RepID=A0A2C5X0A6_9PEZI|nr:Pre-mRNA-splicing factor cwf19 [Ceratocystis fimbriata CBS 114723]
MDSDLAAFEKSLAAEKEQRDREAEREKRHHQKSSGHHRSSEGSNRHHESRSSRHRHKDRDRSRDRSRSRDRDRRDKEREEHSTSRHHERTHGHKSSRHHSSSRSHKDRTRGHDHEDDEDRHRHKRSRYDNEKRNRSRERSRTRDTKKHHIPHDKMDSSTYSSSSQPNAEAASAPKPSRDSWMTAPSSLDIDYVHRHTKEAPPSRPPQETAPRKLHRRELNQGLNSLPLVAADSDSEFEPEDEIKINYKFGDEGSKWRMVKLEAVYRTAKEESRPVDEVALERYGSLQEFDIAREEKDETEKRRLYGAGYEVKDGPDGSLYAERIKSAPKANLPAARHQPDIPLRSGIRMPHEQGSASTPSATIPPPIDQTALNRMRAAMMKAKLRKAPNAAKLEEEYNSAAAAFATNPNATTASKDVILGAMESRLLAGTRGETKAVDTKRGRERGTVVENTDMSIEDMVREERRTRGATGGEAMRMAERIAKDSKFDADLDYMDENAAKLAQRVHKSEINLKNTAVHEFQKVQRILDNCQLCEHEDSGTPPVAPVVALATRVYLTLSPDPAIAQDAAVIVPRIHHTNLLECNDDEWEEIRNFMKSLTRMYHDQGRDVVFYENAAAPHRRPHAAMVAVPIPYEDGAMVPAYFREAFLSADEEWSQHKKVIDTGKAAREGLGRSAFRKMIAKEAPYFHAWFTLDGGLGHVIENSDKWPRGDLFAREVLGGMMDVAPEIQKKQGRWNRNDRRVDGFKSKWRKFDWTRVFE